MVVARTERESLELSALCPGDPFETRDAEADDELATAIVAQTEDRRRHVVNATRFYFVRYRPLDDRPASAQEWHKPLDALANAWSRLLLLVGWRR
jgi:hypothetical protein